jgi:hypothetical protein
MPLSTTHSSELSHQPVVRKLPKTEETLASKSMKKFLFQELNHWLSDLGERNLEGKYYLEWFSWLEPEAAASDNVQIFESLVRETMPSLRTRIVNDLQRKEEIDMEELLDVQRSYRLFCERFDRIKRLLLADVEIRNNYRIY